MISVPDELSDNDLSDSFTRPAPVASSSRPSRVLPLPPKISPPSDPKDSLTEKDKGDEDGEGEEEEGAVLEADEHEDGERPRDHHAFDREYFYGLRQRRHQHQLIGGCLLSCRRLPGGGERV